MILVPRVGVEPTRPYGQRILRTLRRVSPSLTKRYEPVFTRVAVVKVSLGLATYQHVRPPSWPHLFRFSSADAHSSHRRNCYVRWIATCAKYFLSRRHIIRISRQKNVVCEFLRVSIVKREPGALHLYHDAMSF